MESGSSTEVKSIYVKSFTGNTFSLEVDPLDNIGDVKVKIRAKEGIPVNQQALIFNKMVLDDTNTIQDFEIDNHSTLKLMRKSKGLMRIFVKIRKGMTIYLVVKPSDTIDKVKAMIWDKEGIHREQQELVFNEMVLDDSGTLVDFDIKKDSTIKLMFKSRGLMKIFVKNVTTGTTSIISLMVKLTDTISKVKDKIKVQVHIPLDEQVLIFNEMVLEDSSTLADFQINMESTLTLVRKSRGFFKICVQTMSGRTFTLEVKTLDTVWDLKTMIWEKEDIPSCDQRLMFGGRQLMDIDTLADYKIFNSEDYVYLVSRLKGS